jgi:hypothetical protein
MPMFGVLGRPLAAGSADYQRISAVPLVLIRGYIWILNRNTQPEAGPEDRVKARFRIFISDDMYYL